jgi:sec-independent protein translocase protein TatB
VSGIGFSELLLLALIALLVVGPRRLPEIARTAGQLSRTARNAWQSLKSEFQAELDREHNRQIMADESEQHSQEAQPEQDDDRSERS